MKIVKKTSKVAKKQVSKLMELVTLENVVSLLLTLFVILDLQPSMQLASVFSSALGYFILFIGLGLVVANLNPIVTVIYIIFAYELMKRSSIKAHGQIMKFMPGEATRSQYMNKTQFFPQTLEEKVILDRVPPVKYSEPNSFDFIDSVSKGINYSKV